MPTRTTTFSHFNFLREPKRHSFFNLFVILVPLFGGTMCNAHTCTVPNIPCALIIITLFTPEGAKPPTPSPPPYLHRAGFSLMPSVWLTVVPAVFVVRTKMALYLCPT
jgi:hypothetical protein